MSGNTLNAGVNPPGIFSKANINHKRNETLVFGSLLTGLATIAIGLTVFALGKNVLSLKDMIAITAGTGVAGLALTSGLAWAFHANSSSEAPNQEANNSSQRGKIQYIDGQAFLVFEDDDITTREPFTKEQVKRFNQFS